MSSSYPITVEIGGMPILLHTQDDSFRQMLARRYAGFVNHAAPPRFEFDIELTTPSRKAPDEDVQVKMQDGTWQLRRGDFRAHWNPAAGRGSIRQSANPYSIDSVLRIVHTLILAQEGGFLLHSAGAIRNGRAFLFSGVSGAGKTTISRLAPSRRDSADRRSLLHPARRRWLSRLRNTLRRRTGPRGRKLFRSHRIVVLPQARPGKQD